MILVTFFLQTPKINMSDLQLYGEVDGTARRNGAMYTDEDRIVQGI